jgi:hypothetical protein
MALLGAFPPWVLRAPWPGYDRPVGLHFILTPPPRETVSNPSLYYGRNVISWSHPSLDYGRLVVSWSVVGLLTVAGALAVRRQRDRPGDTAHPQPPRPSDRAE